MGNPTDIDLNLRLLLEELWYVSPEFPRQRILKDQIRLIACEPKLELTITPQDAHRHLRGSLVITVFPKTPAASVPPCPTDRRPPPNREPTHPGEMLLEEFLKPMGLSRRGLARGIHLPSFGAPPRHRWDLYWAEKAKVSELERIKPIRESNPPARAVKR